MKNHKLIPASFRGAAVFLAVVLFAAGCAKKEAGQPSFNSPEEAVTAFVNAFQKGDRAELGKLLGPGTDDLLSSGDAVADKADRDWFLSAYNAKHSIDADGTDKMTLSVGENAWPMPIPIVKKGGKWMLDGAEGADEIVYRRVGRNELDVIDVCRGFVSAQQEYASEGRDGDPAGIYALKLISDEGMHNGLYWPTAEDESPSPVGPFVAEAAAEGYRRAEGGARTPYHGYYYSLLYKQGTNANGGAKEYFKDGLLTQGFAMVAWPADYGASGVQTFIVNQDGVVFQKDLGEDTATAVAAITTYDPDSSWTAIAPPVGDAAVNVDTAVAPAN